MMIRSQVMKKNTLLKLMIKERNIRLSPEYQTECHLANTDQSPEFSDWIHMTESVQKNIARDFIKDNLGECYYNNNNYNNNNNNNNNTSGKNITDLITFIVNTVREAPRMFPELGDIAIQHKFNRAKECTIKIGQPTKNVKLFKMDNLKEISLVNEIDPDKVTLVISASIT